jgi:hypothetical protein
MLLEAEPEITVAGKAGTVTRAIAAAPLVRADKPRQNPRLTTRPGQMTLWGDAGRRERLPAQKTPAKGQLIGLAPWVRPFYCAE